MGHKQKQSLIKQMSDKYDSLFVPGRSKYQDKHGDGIREYIYSYSTLKSYKKHAAYYLQWAKTEHKIRTLADAKPYINDWLAIRIKEGKAAPTIKLESAALAKLYGCSTRDFISTPARHRADITRSRGMAARDVHFSLVNNQELINFCRGTGLRRVELEHLKPRQLWEHNGNYYLHIKGKGGRWRDAPIIGAYKQEIIDRIQMTADDAYVWGRVSGHADIHGYRADYATSIYRAAARPLDTLTVADKYYCRGDMKGVVLDRAAMAEPSEALGHSRINVIAGHYIRLEA